MIAASHPQVYGLVPAAGVSRRMGAAKQLLPCGKSSMVEVVVQAVGAGGVEGLVLVTNPPVADALGSAFNAQHNVVVLDDPAAEMIDSIIAGVLALRTIYQPQDHDAFLVCPGDLPRMTAALVRTCADAYRAHPGWIVAPATEGRPRHPLVVPFALAGELGKLHGVGLQGLLSDHQARLHTIAIPSDPAVQDVDTPDEYASLRRPPPA